MMIHLTDFSAEPLHRQICRQLTAGILSGQIASGTSLQPPPAFAKEHKVSMSTVERAYQELKREGWITLGSAQSIIVNRVDPQRRQAMAEQQVPAVTPNHGSLVDELTAAHSIQAGLLPKSLPNTGHFQVAAHAESSLPIGGDFYDCLPIDEHRHALVIADACGKGLPAALLISQIQAIVKNEVQHRSSIAQTMKNLNQHVRRHSTGRHFVSLFYGVYDQHSGVLEFANAGHHPPVLLRQDGEPVLLRTTGPALSLMPAFDDHTETVQLAQNESVLFYTDGIIETMNSAREEFGEQRLLDLFIRNHAKNADAIIRRILEALRMFQASQPVQDDRTVMILKRSTKAE